MSKPHKINFQVYIKLFNSTFSTKIRVSAGAIPSQAASIIEEKAHPLDALFIVWGEIFTFLTFYATGAQANWSRLAASKAKRAYCYQLSKQLASKALFFVLFNAIFKILRAAKMPSNFK